jgi:hypothetical protein
MILISTMNNLGQINLRIENTNFLRPLNDVIFGTFEIDQCDE